MELWSPNINQMIPTCIDKSACELPFYIEITGNTYNECKTCASGIPMRDDPNNCIDPDTCSHINTTTLNGNQVQICEGSFNDEYCKNGVYDKNKNQFNCYNV